MKYLLFTISFSFTFRIRAEGLGKLTFFLAHEKDSLDKLPQFSDLDVSNLTNILLVEEPLDTMKSDKTKSVFMVNIIYIDF